VVGFGDLVAHVVERRTGRGDAERMAAKLVSRGEASVVSLGGGEQQVADHSLLLSQRSADYLDRAFFGKAHKAAAHGGHGIVSVARGNRHSHRLCGLEELEFDVQAFVLVVAALESNEAWRMASEAHHAEVHLGVLRESGLAEDGHCAGSAHARQDVPAIDCELRHCSSSNYGYENCSK